MNSMTRLGSLALFSAFFAACSSGPPMQLVQVPVEPATVMATVLLHENFEDAIAFDAVRVERMQAANQLDVQCRMTNNLREGLSGTYTVEFFDASARRISTTNSRPWSMPEGGQFLIEARSTTGDAESITISIR